MFSVSSRGATPLNLALDRDIHGNTALHLAALRGHDAIVTWLVESFGRTAGLSKNSQGQTALHYAAAKGWVHL